MADQIPYARIEAEAQKILSEFQAPDADTEFRAYLQQPAYVVFQARLPRHVGHDVRVILHENSVRDYDHAALRYAAGLLADLVAQNPVREEKEIERILSEQEVMYALDPRAPRSFPGE